MRTTFIACCLLLSLQSYGQEKTKSNRTNKSDTQSGKTKERAMACTLTTPELDERKTTILISLRTQIVTKKELANGYRYQFKGADSTIDELVSFIKTERHCCSFFDFGLQITGDGSAVWLTITGPKGAKEFIRTELEL